MIILYQTLYILSLFVILKHKMIKFINSIFCCMDNYLVSWLIYFKFICLLFIAWFFSSHFMTNDVNQISYSVLPSHEDIFPSNFHYIFWDLNSSGFSPNLLIISSLLAYEFIQYLFHPISMPIFHLFLIF